MGLFSFFKRDGKRAPAAAKSARAPQAGSADEARVRARHRLIGAAVLVVLGVVGFPLLFDSQPRPLSVDIPIEIPAKDTAPPLPAPKPKSATAPAPVSRSTPAAERVQTETTTDAGREVGSPAAQTTEDAAAQPKPEKSDQAADKPSAKSTDKKPAAAKPIEKPAADTAAAKPAAKDGVRAQALLNGGTADEGGAAGGRFVVQVGAFSEVMAAREVRHRVEKLGLKTYTQVVETSAGRRIRVRVGPFGERGEAEKAADKLKQAGLNVALLTL